MLLKNGLHYRIELVEFHLEYIKSILEHVPERICPKIMKTDRFYPIKGQFLVVGLSCPWANPPRKRSNSDPRYLALKTALFESANLMFKLAGYKKPHPAL
jgi:hypothetical protein